MATMKKDVYQRCIIQSSRGRSTTNNEIEEHHFKAEKAIIDAAETNDVDDVFEDQKLNNLLQEANADVEYVALRRMVRNGLDLHQK